MSANATPGTVKVGRWTYPATLYSTGHATRNTKRDGSGTVVPVESGRELESFIPEVEEPFTDEVGDALEALTPVQRALMTIVGGAVDGQRFDFFDDGVVEHSGIWFTHMSEQTPAPALVRRHALKLTRGEAPLWTISDPEHDVAHGDRWFALTALGAAVANRLSGTSVDETVLTETGSKHGGKVGAQVNKPGKSSWKVGGPCPQGTHVLTDENLYTMPSGRSQCRDCRRGYPSNI